MSVRQLGALAGALAVGGLVVACATQEPTATRSISSGPNAATTPSCSPDVTPPTITSVTASPNTLWPPNHKFVPVTVSTVATDNCSTPQCSISSVTSNEPVNGLGDGDTSPDWIVNGSQSLLLRAERSGTGTGRVYTVLVTCTDAAGNTAQQTVAVTVPHDQGNGGSVSKCTRDDHGHGDEKNGDRDIDNKCKNQG